MILYTDAVNIGTSFTAGDTEVHMVTGANEESITSQDTCMVRIHMQLILNCYTHIFYIVQLKHL